MKLVKTVLTDAQAAKLRYGLDLPEDDVPAGTVYIMQDDVPPAGTPKMPPGTDDAIRQVPLSD